MESVDVRDSIWEDDAELERQSDALAEILARARAESVLFIVAVDVFEDDVDPEKETDRTLDLVPDVESDIRDELDGADVVVGDPDVDTLFVGVVLTVASRDADESIVSELLLAALRERVADNVDERDARGDVETVWVATDAVCEIVLVSDTVVEIDDDKQFDSLVVVVADGDAQEESDEWKDALVVVDGDADTDEETDGVCDHERNGDRVASRVAGIERDT